MLHSMQLRHRVRPVVGLTAALCGVLTLTVGCGSSVHGQSAGPFTGYWHVHTFSLTIQHDGAGVFEWPLHTDCSPPLGPCSAGNSSDQGRATISLTSVSSTTATGRVSGSNQQYVVPDGSVSLTIDTENVVHLRFTTPPAVPSYAYLCGEKTNANLVNCGA